MSGNRPPTEEVEDERLDEFRRAASGVLGQEWRWSRIGDWERTAIPQVRVHLEPDEGGDTDFIGGSKIMSLVEKTGWDFSGAKMHRGNAYLLFTYLG